MKKVIILVMILSMLIPASWASCRISDSISLNEEKSYSVVEGDITIDYTITLMYVGDEDSESINPVAKMSISTVRSGEYIYTDVKNAGITPYMYEGYEDYLGAYGEEGIIIINSIDGNSVDFCISVDAPDVPMECRDKVMNGDEEGIDCGGSCPNKCSASWQIPPSDHCSDGKVNWGETKRDCGGQCSPCQGECETDSDCDDKVPSTRDKCAISPDYFAPGKMCFNYKVTKCEDDDGACPSSCTFQNDNDCEWYECLIDEDCDDNDVSTVDKCDAVTRECSNTLQTQCRSGDDYCPESCDISNDIDCPECEMNSDCDDNEASTLDSCSGLPKRCSNDVITGCNTGDGYCPAECKFENDEDCPQCLGASECDDADACTEDRCEGDPKKCVNDRKSSGCGVEDKCVSVGTRIEKKYCNTDNSIKEQKPVQSSCSVDYECMSEKCEDSQCTDQNMIEKVISWIKNLFGGK